MSLATEIAKALESGSKLQVWEIPIQKISAIAYTAADAVGGAFVLPNASRIAQGAGSIISVTVIDLADQAAALQLALFNAPFVATVDNSPIDLSDADAVNCVGMLSIATTDYGDWGGFQIGSVKNQWLGYQCLNGNLYGQLKTTGTPTYGLSDLKLRIVALWDQP